MANEKTQALYNQLSKDGYDLGDYNTFSTKLSDQAKAKALHDTIIKDGYDVGDFDTFFSKVGQMSGVAAPEQKSYAMTPEIQQGINVGNGGSVADKNSNKNNPLPKEEAAEVIYGSLPGEVKFKTGAGQLNTLGVDMAMKNKFGGYQDSGSPSISVPENSIEKDIKPKNIPTGTYDPEQLAQERANNEQEQRELNAPAFSNDNLKHLYKVFSSSMAGMGGAIGTAALDISSQILKADPHTVHDEEYKKLQGNLTKAQKDVLKWQTEDAPKLKGTFGESLVSAVPMVGLVAADMLSSGTLTPATITAFGAMGWGEGLQSADAYAEQNGMQLSEAQRHGAAVGYTLAYTIPVGKYIDKFLVKGAGKYVMSKVLTSNPELMIKVGQEIIEAAAKQSPSLASKIIKTSMSSALHGVGTMEAIDLVKMATDKVVMDKNVSLDEFKERVLKNAEAGLIFGLATAPFAIHTSIKANESRRNAQGEVTFTIDDKGKSVEILPSKEGKVKGMRPDGSIVDVTQSMLDNSFTMTTAHFNEVVKGYKGNKKSVSAADKTISEFEKRFESKAPYMESIRNEYNYDKNAYIEQRKAEMQQRIDYANENDYINKEQLIAGYEAEISKLNSVQEAFKAKESGNKEILGDNFERDAFSNRLSQSLKKVATSHGNITVAKDAEGNNIYVQGRNENGELIGIDSLGKQVIIPEGTETVTQNIGNVHESIMRKYDEARSTTEQAPEQSPEQLKIEQRNQQIDDATQNAQTLIENISNNGQVIEAKLKGVDQPVNIVKGDVFLNEDGSVDMTKSSKTFIYKTNDGKSHPGNLDFIEDGSVTITPNEEAINQTIEPITNQIANEEAPEHEIGSKVVIKDQKTGFNSIVTITGRDQDGNYTFKSTDPDGNPVQGGFEPREVNQVFNGVFDGNGVVEYINPDTGETMTGVLELDTPEAQQQFTEGNYAKIDGQDIPFENIKGQYINEALQEQPEGQPEGLLPEGPTEAQNAGVEAEAQAETPVTPKTFKEQIPVQAVLDGKGKPTGKTSTIYEQAPIETTIGALKEQFDSEEVQQVVTAKIKKIESDIEKAGKLKITGDIDTDAANKAASKQALQGLNEQLSYWNGVNEAIKPVEEVQPEIPMSDSNKDYYVTTAKSGTDVNDIKNAYDMAMSESEIETLLPWQTELLSMKIHPDSFNELGDRNYATDVRAWLLPKKTQRIPSNSIDTIAEELSSYGIEVTPDMIVEFMTDHPNMRAEKGNEYTRDLSRRFSEVATKMAGMPIGGLESKSGKVFLAAINSIQNKNVIFVEPTARELAFVEDIPLEDDSFEALFNAVNEIDVNDLTNFIQSEYEKNAITDETVSVDATGQSEPTATEPTKEVISGLENFDFAALMDAIDEPITPEQQAKIKAQEDAQLEKEYQQMGFDKKWAPTRAIAIQKLNENIAKNEAIIKDWSARVYKKSGGKTVEVGDKNDDYDIRNVDVDGVNERRRTNVIKNAQSEIDDDIKDLKRLGVDPTVDQQIQSQDINTTPTEAQKEAGNYKKGHVVIQDMDITIENPKGSIRSGVDEDGKAWEHEMNSHYGYFKGTVGRDGDHVDTFVGNNPESKQVFVIDQINPKSGKFDESKVMLGYESAEQAKAAYLENYDKDWKGFYAITEVGVDDFKTWLYDGKKQHKPFAEYKDTPEPHKQLSEIPIKNGSTVNYNGKQYTVNGITSDGQTVDLEGNGETIEDVDVAELGIEYNPEPTDLKQPETAEEFKPEVTYGANNSIVTADRYEALKKRMQDKLNPKDALNESIPTYGTFDPEVLSIGTEMAAFHIEAGANSFADFSQRMIADLGDNIKPYLKGLYNGARDLPGMEKFEPTMTEYSEVKKYNLDNLTQNQNNVTKNDVTLPNEIKSQDNGSKPSRTGSKQTQPKSNGLSLFDDMEGQGASSENIAGDSKNEQLQYGNGSSQSGNRPQYDVNKSYTNDEIHEIVSSVTELKDGKIELTGEVTDDIKTIASRYISGGVAKQGRGILDEYYTSSKIVDQVRSLISKYFPQNKNIRFLEPSVGIGNFINVIPTDKADIVTFEINETTARIAKIFNPTAEVNLRSFETEFIDDSGKKKPITRKYNLVAGNPPYGEHRGMYKGLGEESKISKYEDYFVKRSLDVLDEGGILAMVLPSTWMDRHKVEAGFTIEVAYRLPSGAFESTQVGTDIVILKKQSGNLNLQPHNYFENNSDNVLGEIKERSNRFGKMEQYVSGDIDAALSKIEQNTAKTVAGELRFDPTNDNLNDISESIDETGSKDKTKKVIKASKPTTVQVTSGKVEIKKGTLKYELKKGDEVVPASVQFPNEFTPEQEAAFKVADYAGIIPKSEYENHKQFANFVNFDWVHDFYYAEGNIYQKLEQLERDKPNMSQEQYDKQKKMLKSVLPKTKPIEKISLSPNTEFVKNLSISSSNSETGLISVKDLFMNFVNKLPSDAFGDSNRWEVSGFVDNNQVYGSDKERNALVRERRKATANNLFKKFLSDEITDTEKSQIEYAFNREYNAMYRPDYSKVPMFSEINKNFKGNPLQLTVVQRAGIGRSTVKGVGILAHEVGFGKTLSGILAVHEAMTRGTSKKPLIVAPNDGVLKQWIDTIHDVLPYAKINVLGNLGVDYDLTGFNVEDGEITLVTYEGFKSMGFKDNTYDSLSRKFSYIFDDLNAHKSERDRQKDKAKQDELAGKMRRGKAYDFEDFGFDHLTFDEVHNANHIVGKVKLEKKDASDFRSQSQRTSDLGIKTWLASQYIQENNDGRNVLLLSATPFTNKPLEYYSILSLVGNSTLERMGFFRVDQFFETFMEADNDIEIKADGTPAQKTNVRRFKNNGLFNQLLSEFIDIKGEDDNPDLVRPLRHNREYKIPQNDLTASTIANIQELFNNNESVLKGITHSRLVAFSPYASYYSFETPKNHKEFVVNSPKIHTAIKLIEQNKKSNPEGGQLIYSEIGVEFFPMIQDYLVKESGFKPSEVKIISGATSLKERANIQHGFNKGDIKVIIGSPAIKEGINLQENTTDMYILSLPYNFTQLRQVEGRSWRQGNKWSNIRVNYMLTDNSVDVFLLQRLQIKQGLYNEAMKSGAETIDVSDIDTSELKTALITDPTTRANIELMIEKGRLESEKTRISSDLAFVHRKYEKYNEFKNKLDSEIKDLQNREELAKKDEWWNTVVDRIKRQVELAKNNLEQEKQKLAEKGVNVDDIVNQEANSTNQIAEIDTKIEALKDKFNELVSKYTEENIVKSQKEGDVVSKYLKEREAENKGKFYTKRVSEQELREHQPEYTPGKSIIEYAKEVNEWNKANEAKQKYGVSDIGFYSTVEKSLNAIQQEKGTKDQFKAMLLKNGAKQAEMDWMGFDELPEKLTKADIKNWIEENRIEVKEVHKKLNENIELIDSEGKSLGIFPNKEEAKKSVTLKGGWLNTVVGERLVDGNGKTLINLVKGVPETNTKYSNYVLPGGENYKELLLTMPEKEMEVTYSDSDILNKAKEEGFTFDDKTGIVRKNGDIWDSASSEKEWISKLRNRYGDGTIVHPNGIFKSAHYDEPNILAHIRFNERTVNGERVLFIEEFQSDFSQSLKKKEDEFKKLLKENPEKVLDMFKKSGKLEVLCP